MPQWSTHVGNNTVLEDDVVFLHKQEELAVAHGLGKKPVAQVSMTSGRYVPLGVVASGSRTASACLCAMHGLAIRQTW